MQLILMMATGSAKSSGPDLCHFLQPPALSNTDLCSRPTPQMYRSTGTPFINENCEARLSLPWGVSNHSILFRLSPVKDLKSNHPPLAGHTFKDCAESRALEMSIDLPSPIRFEWRQQEQEVMVVTGILVLWIYYFLCVLPPRKRCWVA